MKALLNTKTNTALYLGTKEAYGFDAFNLPCHNFLEHVDYAMINMPDIRRLRC